VIGSLLRQAGHTVTGLDMPYFTFDQALDRLAAQQPDVVGMSCWTGAHQVLLALARGIKARMPQTRVVFGGHHATLFWRQLLERFPEVDAVILGEGEKPLPVLLQAWEEGGEPEGVPGIAYRKNGEARCTGMAVRLTNLDELPFPAFDLFHISRDVGTEVRYGAKQHPGKDRRIVTLASRGCPFQCTFCVDGKFYTKAISRDPKLVVDEIELLNREYRVGLFEFSDMTFTLAQKRTAALCEEILRRGLSVSWQAMSRVNCVSPQLLRLMKEAGCYSISFGVETGSPELLDRIHKAITREQIEEAFHKAHEAGLSTVMLLMVGNPGESDQTINETIDLIYETRPTQIDVSIYQVYPGSATYNELSAAGYISSEYWIDHGVAPYYTGEHPIKRLVMWQKKIIYHHHSYPRDFGKKFFSWIRRPFASTSKPAFQ
jgi:radical SAM superfamily enzyme YgiQ (UPF0313 family)